MVVPIVVCSSSSCENTRNLAICVKIISKTRCSPVTLLSERNSTIIIFVIESRIVRPKLKIIFFHLD